MGKTRLVAEIAEVARRRGAVVASSQCFGASTTVALAPVADWLRNPLVRSAAATLDEVWRAEIDRLVPAEGRARRGKFTLAALGIRGHTVTVYNIWAAARSHVTSLAYTLAAGRAILLRVTSP